MFHPQGPSFFELAQQALSSTKKGYDLLAPKFDYTPFRTPDEVLAPVAAHLKKSGPFANGLDVCCGTGAATRMLANVCTDRLVGVDFSEGMLHVAQENEKQHAVRSQAQPDNGPVTEWQQADVLDLAWQDEFDVAVSFGAFGHFLPDEQLRLLDQITKALRTGGRFVFVTTEMPGKFSRAYWLSQGFNLAMRIRNLFYRPPFIMYYLTFLLPDIARALESRGYQVEVLAPYSGRLKSLRIVDALLHKRQ
jgi:SAM-dependent methyltransferase